MLSHKNKFCEKCDNYLKLIEDENNLYYQCMKCENSEKIFIKNTLIYHKEYKNTDYNSIELNNIIKNKYHIEDPSLPKNKTKCIHCKKINSNPYIVKYIEMKFNIINICINCNKNFIS